MDGMRRPSATGSDRGELGDLDAFLHLLGQATRRPEPGAARNALVEWLHRDLGVEVALVEDGGGSGESGVGDGSGSSYSTVLATPRFPTEVPKQLRPLLTRVAQGRVSSAASAAGAFHVLLEPVGAMAPRPVLLVAATGRLPSAARRRVAHASSLLAALDRAGAAEEAALAHRHKAHQVRLGVYMTLMMGDVLLARRMTAGDVPALLDGKHVRVGVLRCTPEERDSIAQPYEDPSGYHGTGLMVRCPVYDEHLICAFADDDGPDVPGGPGGPGGSVGDEPDDPDESPHDIRVLPGTLRSLAEFAEQQPHLRLGVSGRWPLAEVGTAYEQARHALAATLRGPRHVAVFTCTPNLSQLLPADVTLPWARWLLAPLAAAPDQTVAITRLALQFPRSAVARLLGVSRNTVAAHVRRAEEALGLDLNAVGTRAALALALSVTSPADAADAADAAGVDAAAAGDVAPESGQQRPRLAPAFQTGAARAWAAEFLRPLERHDRRLDLWATLREWIAYDADAQRAARTLGISRNTVTAHLQTAERLLGRDLVTLGNGAYDLIHALHITGRIPAPTLLR